MLPERGNERPQVILFQELVVRFAAARFRFSIVVKKTYDLLSLIAAFGS